MSPGNPVSPAPSASAGAPVTGESGFTLIEVLVAGVLLVIGAFATLALVDRGAASTGSSLQRDRGNALAREIVERATGMRQVRITPSGGGTPTDVNELVGLAPLGATVRPELEVATRLSAALDPDGDGSSSTPTLVAVPDRYVQRSTWQTTRSGARYTITYRACTASDRVQGVVLQGDMDCDRVAPAQQPAPTGPLLPAPGGGAGQCGIALAAGSTLPVSASAAVNDVTVRLQLLNTVGVGACVGSLLSSLGLDGVVQPLCGALGPVGATTAGILSGVNGLLGSLGSSAALGICPKDDVKTQAPIVSDGVATSTRIETTVSWTDPSTRRPVSVRQAAVVRRGTATAP